MWVIGGECIHTHYYTNDHFATLTRRAVTAMDEKELPKHDSFKGTFAGTLNVPVPSRKPNTSVGHFQYDTDIL